MIHLAITIAAYLKSEENLRRLQNLKHRNREAQLKCSDIDLPVMLCEVDQHESTVEILKDEGLLK